MAELSSSLLLLIRIDHKEQVSLHLDEGLPDFLQKIMKQRSEPKMSLNEIYTYVTATLIKLLEKHELEEYSTPWIRLDSENKPARNAMSGNNYRGINQLLLSFYLSMSDYYSNQWLTYNQALSAGGHVKKGEKSIKIIFYKSSFIDKNKKYYKPDRVKSLSPQIIESRGIQSIPILKLYNVFNIAQTEGLDPALYERSSAPPLNDEFTNHEQAEQIILNTKADVRVQKSDRAYYSPKGDYVVNPLREQFNQESDFYSTIFHELSHWTGAEHRLNREFGKSFGDRQYAMEELVADISSAMVMASLGTTQSISKNASYIKTWLGVLKENNKAIVRASQHAQKSADFILGL